MIPFTLSDAQVAAVDEMMEFMHPKNRPHFPSIATAQGIKPERFSGLYTQNGLVTPRSHGISIVGAEQGLIDTERNQKLRKAAI